MASRIIIEKRLAFREAALEKLYDAYTALVDGGVKSYMRVRESSSTTTAASYSDHKPSFPTAAPQNRRYRNRRASGNGNISVRASVRADYP